MDFTMYIFMGSLSVQFFELLFPSRSLVFFFIRGVLFDVGGGTFYGHARCTYIFPL